MRIRETTIVMRRELLDKLVEEEEPETTLVLREHLETLTPAIVEEEEEPLVWETTLVLREHLEEAPAMLAHSKTATIAFGAGFSRYTTRAIKACP
jgi:hypothetical protein